MPMAGGGIRFSEYGYDLPKPMIELQGKPFFYWAVQSIKKFMEVEDIIFVVLEEHIKRYQIDKIILEYFPDAKIISLPKVLNGAVLTCLEGIKSIYDEQPVLFNDCDHAFISQPFNNFIGKSEFNTTDAALLTFRSDCDKYSYVDFDEKGNITGTIEKEVVSNEAICGAYYFRNKEIFIDAAKRYFETCAYQEFFVSGLYNELVKMNKKISTFPLDEHISFGTPEEYKLAQDDVRLEKLQ
jgi:NDP-sugar pyrophosphorylase family protein